MNNNWKNYYKAKENKPPSKFLTIALEFVKNKTNALDLGAGGLVDTIYILSEGFYVTSVDSSAASAKLAENIKNEHFIFINSTFDSVNFKEDEYDLITAQWALPFNPQDTFNKMFEDVKTSLKKGGIFTAQFFGPNDEWNKKDSTMTFHSKEEIENLLIDFNIIKFKEIEEDKPNALGTMKHWHVFHVIAEKKN